MVEGELLAPEGWELAYTDEGQPYCFNSETSESQWYYDLGSLPLPPAGAASRSLISPSATLQLEGPSTLMPTTTQRQMGPPRTASARTTKKCCDRLSCARRRTAAKPTCTTTTPVRSHARSRADRGNNTARIRRR